MAEQIELRMPLSRKKVIPRKIWLLWYQGLAEAPFIVRKCIDSWVKENPTWEIIILDKDNLGKYIVLDLPDEKLAHLSLTKQSNLVRLQLLSEYGGVWADATTFCMKPLDDWLDDCTTSGFFAFYKPGPDRIISSWFMVCEKGCPITLKLKERYVSFFMKNDFNIEGRFKQKIIDWLSEILNRSEKTTKYWFSPVVTKLLRVYPYFIFHYMFERLVSSDPECRAIWNNTKKISADEPHKIQTLGFFSPINENIRNEIDQKHTPIYKLMWKYDHNQYSPSSVLYYLLERKFIDIDNERNNHKSLAGTKMNLRDLIHADDPYAQFNYQDYPLDLTGWNSNHPNFETMIEQIRPHLIIEVGSWKGASAIHMARLLQQKALPGHILCIDTWLGSLEMWLRKEKPNFYPSLQLHHGYPAVYYQFLANVKHCGQQEMITPLPQTSSTAARWLQANQITADLIYIDASHEEEDVYRDLTHYWPLINSGGAMFGDDYNAWESVRKAVNKFGHDYNLEVEPRDNQWVIYKTAPAVEPPASAAPTAAATSQLPASGTPHPLIESFLARPNRPQPLLSVIIPCYNTAPFLRQCLDSVLNQTYPNLEIIICDDASTDDSPVIIQEYTARYPSRVKGFFLEQNQGVAFARNYAIVQAQGEYLTLLDSDDYYYDRRKLAYELALVMYYDEEKGQEVAAYSEVVLVDEQGQYLAPLQSPERLKQGMIFEDVLTSTCLPRDFVIRRSNLLSCGEYRPLQGHEDRDMAIRLAARYEFYLTGINGTAWRQRRGSLSASPFFSSPHRRWPIFCFNLERLVADESKKEELAYRFSMNLNEVREGREKEIRILRQVCSERLQLIEELHQAAQERLQIIERQQAELVAKEEVIQKLASTHPVVWLYRLLPHRLRRFLKRR